MTAQLDEHIVLHIVVARRRRAFLRGHHGGNAAVADVLRRELKGGLLAVLYSLGAVQQRLGRVGRGIGLPGHVGQLVHAGEGSAVFQTVGHRKADGLELCFPALPVRVAQEERFVVALILPGLILDDVFVQRQRLLNACRLGEIGALAVGEDGNALDLLRLRLAALIAEHVQLQRREAAQKHHAAQRPAAEAPPAAAEHPEGAADQHLRDEPAQESADHQPEGGDGEDLRLGLAGDVEDIEHHVREAQPRADAHAPAEYRLEHRHRHHVARGLHLPAAQQGPGAEEHDDAHGGVEDHEEPALEVPARGEPGLPDLVVGLVGLHHAALQHLHDGGQPDEPERVEAVEPVDEEVHDAV